MRLGTGWKHSAQPNLSPPHAPQLLCLGKPPGPPTSRHTKRAAPRPWGQWLSPIRGHDTSVMMSMEEPLQPRCCAAKISGNKSRSSPDDEHLMCASSAIQVPLKPRLPCR